MESDPVKSLKQTSCCFSDTRQYLQSTIFPVLLPALEQLLKQADYEKCFERKETKFIPTDFLVHYLYSHNPNHPERRDVPFEKIPFVEDRFMKSPRKPLPKHLLWDEETAALKIQSYFRGYLVRKQEHVQELRHYQKQLWEEQEKLKMLSNKDEKESIDKTPSAWDICLGYDAVYEISDSCSQEGVPMVTPFKEIREWEKYGMAEVDYNVEPPREFPKNYRTFPK